MVRLNSAFSLLGLSLLSSSNAFAPIASTPRHSVGPLNALPEIDSLIQSSNVLLSQVTSDDYGELAKSVVIVLLFGGGLIPAAIAANQAMIGTLRGKRAGGDDGSPYISDSGATGPALPGQALLFASDEIPLVDVIAILGRIQNADTMADWKNLPSTKTAASVMWLTRATYKANIRKAKFNGWPVDPSTGEPIGGAELVKAEKGRISKSNPEIGDAALDAVFDSWAWGASIATADKVEATLALYKDGNSFDLNEFAGAATRGRAVTGLGALSFIVIQTVAYGCLFIAPALRVFADLDIGFGQLGGCDGVCKSLF